jgi:hypothetical protein
MDKTFSKKHKGSPGPSCFSLIAVLTVLMLMVLMTGCSQALEMVSDELSDIAGGRIWREDDTGAKAPTVGELIEQGEIEGYEQSGSLAGESVASGTLPEPGEGMSYDQIIASTEGMLRYSYAFLSESEKELYREIYTVLYNHTSEVTLASLDADQVDKVFQLVMNDHPEIFYVTGYSMNKYTQGDVTVSLEFNGTYDKTLKQVKEAMPRIDEYEKKCFEGLPASGSDYDKAKYIYEYLIDNTEYDLNAGDSQNILSVFTHGRTVCQGYAKATQYLLNRLGIPCLLITGMVKGGESHAWNLARIDGQWTYIDTTWGDASYRNLTTGDTWNEISYDYFCAGEDDFFGTHHVNSLIDLPEAVRVEE